MTTDLSKFPKIRRIGDDENSGILNDGTVAVKEKMDGANFRFRYDTDEDRLVFGSRNVVYKNEKDIDKNFRHAVEFVRENIDTSGMEGVYTFYGEAMHPHTLEYEWDSVPSFLGFDVYHERAGRFMPWDAAGAHIRAAGLPTVPVWYYGPASRYELPEPDELPESEYRNGHPEGVVIVNEDTSQRAKIRHPKFKERHGDQFASKQDDAEDSDSEMLARRYATEARILKWIHKYDDRGRNIEMSIMEDLWRDVFDDIIEEEFEEIFLGNHTIDTKDFRSEVANRTATILDRYLSRPDESVLNEPPAPEQG